MLQTPAQNRLEVPAFVLSIEVRPRRGPDRDPVVGQNPQIAVAHDDLAEDL